MAIADGLPIPRLAKLGAVVVAVGFVADLVEHTLVPHVHDATIAGFPIGEHLAHLIVLVGMVLTLAGIVADGVARGRQPRSERSPHDAVR